MKDKLIKKYMEESDVCMAEFLASEKVPEGMTFEQAFFAYMQCMHEVEGDNFYVVQENQIQDLVTNKDNSPVFLEQTEGTSLIVYPMDCLQGITDEEMEKLHPDNGTFDPNEPYFHYDLGSGLLESLDELTIAHYNDGLPEDQQLVMATPQQALDLKWGHVNASQMTTEERKSFNEDLFGLYEKTGFADTFQTTYSDRLPRNGETFDVVRRARAEDGVEEEQMPMWLIRFDDDTTTLAYPEEITKLNRENKK